MCHDHILALVRTTAPPPLQADPREAFVLQPRALTEGARCFVQASPQIALTVGGATPARAGGTPATPATRERVNGRRMHACLCLPGRQPSRRACVPAQRLAAFPLRCLVSLTLLFPLPLPPPMQLHRQAALARCVQAPCWRRPACLTAACLLQRLCRPRR